VVSELAGRVVLHLCSRLWIRHLGGLIFINVPRTTPARTPMVSRWLGSIIRGNRLPRCNRTRIAKGGPSNRTSLTYRNKGATLVLFEIAGSLYAHNPNVEASNPSPNKKPTPLLRLMEFVRQQFLPKSPAIGV